MLQSDKETIIKNDVDQLAFSNIQKTQLFQMNYFEDFIKITKNVFGKACFEHLGIVIL